jgi:hypothetical protein
LCRRRIFYTTWLVADDAVLGAAFEAAGDLSGEAN